MRIAELLERQKATDELIKANMSEQITDREMLTNTILACMVELGEMANEIKTFKHWSKKPASDRVVILEEYIDVVHFVLSIANQLDFNAQDIVDMYNIKNKKNHERQVNGY